MKKDSNNNIIDFPGPQSLKSCDSQKTKRLRFDLEQRKIMISASLVSILFLVTLLNRSLGPEKELKNTYAIINMKTPASSSGRYIASVEKRGLSHETDDLLAERLAQPNRRTFASIGRKPTARENFVYGDFAKYRDSYVIVFDEIDQHLVSMNYDLPSKISHASIRDSKVKMFMLSPEKFFSSYKSIFPKRAVALVPMGKFTDTDEGRRERAYLLVDNAHKTVSKVKFTVAGTKGEYLYSYQLMN